MPRPPIAQAGMAVHGGSPVATTSMAAVPAATSAKPMTSRRRGPTRSIQRSWTQLPAVHVIDVAVSTRPASSVLPPRPSVTASDT